ncbi:bifunctional metallophosphatase/5'-nucleotidase [Pelomyxa schiedti]|nr:bifunctional metallophosphatase/5'-nucleotidase [Pelomyxa schiedti]
MAGRIPPPSLSFPPPGPPVQSVPPLRPSDIQTSRNPSPAPSATATSTTTTTTSTSATVARDPDTPLAADHSHHHNRHENHHRHRRRSSPTNPASHDDPALPQKRAAVSLGGDPQVASPAPKRGPAAAAAAAPPPDNLATAPLSPDSTQMVGTPARGARISSVLACGVCKHRVDQAKWAAHQCPNKSKIWICPICGPKVAFQDSERKKFTAHVNSEHKKPVPPTQPPQPTVTNDSHASAASHTLQAPPQTTLTSSTIPWTSAAFPCSVCRVVLEDGRSLKKHKKEQKHEGPTLWRCRHCGVDFPTQQGHAGHIGNISKQETKKKALSQSEIDTVINRVREALRSLSKYAEILPPVHMRDIKPKAHHGTQPLTTPSEYQVFPAQKAEANLFFQRVKENWNEFPNSCRSLDVLILVPPRNSLYNQTQQRVESFKKHIASEFGGKRNLRISVVKGNNYKQSKEDTKAFFEKAARCKSLPDHFFVIIHDECHWGARTSGDKKLGRISSILRKALVTPGSNMLTLQISATAWNQIELLKQSFSNIAGLLEKHVHGWLTTATPETGMEYMGRRKLMDLQCILKSDLISPGTCKELCKDLFPNDADDSSTSTYSKLIDSGDWSTFVSLMAYAAAFIKRHCEEYGEAVPDARWIQIVDCPYTLEAVRLIKEGYMVAVRLPSILSRYYGEIISRLLAGMGEERFFCVHDAIDSAGFEGDIRSKTLVSTSCAAKLAELQQTNNAVVKSYQDFNRLPFLLVLVEKARMGDTMPSHLKLFDLRARYKSKNGARLIHQLQQNPVAALRDSDGQLDRCLKKTDRPEQASDQPQPESLAVFFHPDFIWEQSDRDQWKLENIPNLASKLKQRFVISAEPQIGKTGAYLYFIELLVQHFNLPPIDKNEKKLHALLQSLTTMNPEKLHQNLSTDRNTLDQWRRLHALQDEYFRTMLRPGQPPEEVIPSARAAKFVRSLSGPTSCKVADMGCGTCALARYLDTNRQIQVTNYDHALYAEEPTDYQIVQCDFRTTGAQEHSFDIVVFCMSLGWGGARPEFVQQAIKEAARICKPTGYIFVADEKSRWSWYHAGGASDILLEEFRKVGFTVMEAGLKVTTEYFFLAVHPGQTPDW